MAQIVNILLLDDTDLSLTADEIVSFGLDGASLEIDLSQVNAEAFRAMLAPYIAVARKSGRKVTKAQAKASATRKERLTNTSVPPSNGSADNTTLRQWAESRGITVKPRGRIPAEVKAQYALANP